MKISALDPIGPAWNHMVRILFRPFDLKKWFVLGFCAFLATLGEGGGGGSNVGQSFGERGRELRTSQMVEWIETHVGLLAGIGVLVLLAILAFTVLLLWLSSRGHFMFLDGLIKNRGAVKEPWGEYREDGNSLCGFRILVSVLSLVLIFGVFATSYAIALPDLRQDEFGDSAVFALFVCIPLVILIVGALVLIEFLLMNFVVPVMYKQRVPVRAAWSVAWKDVVAPRIGTTLLLMLIRFVLGIASATVAIMVICMTLCCAALPYISSVVFLPITAFFFAYRLCYIEQLGEEWRFFPPAQPTDAGAALAAETPQAD